MRLMDKLSRDPLTCGSLTSKRKSNQTLVNDVWGTKELNCGKCLNERMKNSMKLGADEEYKAQVPPS